jgi:hypothetical protein
LSVIDWASSKSHLQLSAAKDGSDGLSPDPGNAGMIPNPISWQIEIEYIIDRGTDEPSGHFLVRDTGCKDSSLPPPILRFMICEETILDLFNLLLSSQ